MIAKDLKENVIAEMLEELIRNNLNIYEIEEFIQLIVEICKIIPQHRIQMIMYVKQLNSQVKVEIFQSLIIKVLNEFPANVLN